MTNFQKWIGKESDFQTTAARYLDHLGVLWNHCPNGGSRHKREAANLKAQGVKAGFPDVAIYEPRGKYHGLFIELKRDGAKPRPNQVEWLKSLKKRGYFVEHTDSLDEFIEIVDNYLKLT